MTIQINGGQREVPDGVTLEALLGWLDLPLDRIAVERNLKVVSRSRWSETAVIEGDRLEVVQLVGGGTVKRGSGGRRFS